MTARLSLLTLLSAALLGGATSAQAASGIFGTGAVFTTNGSLTLYQSTLLGDGRHAPQGASPTVVSSGFDGLDLGTFDPGAGNTLVLNGGGILTFKNGPDDVFGGEVFYSIDGAPFASLTTLAFNQDLGSGDQRWYSDGSSVDVLSGLSNGSHTIAVRYESPFNFGTHQSGAPGSVGNNSPTPYQATFEVIPEPSTSLLGALGGLLLLRRRR